MLRFSDYLLITGALCVGLFLHHSPGISLVLGVASGTLLTRGQFNAVQWSRRLMGIAITALGATITIGTVYQLGKENLLVTVGAIALTMVVGWGLGRFLKLPGDLSALIAVGTAICGASAIAALGSAIKAAPEKISIALGVVLLFNTTALFLFPVLGHLMNLPSSEFASWAGLAIHDTSSVVGAAVAYDPLSVDVATTVKLARAVWILPLVLLYQKLLASQGTTRPRLPWFLWCFLLCSVGCTLFTPSEFAIQWIKTGARAVFATSLFLMGSTIEPRSVRDAGFSPLVLGGVLWIASGSLALWWILFQ